jgi:excisionase family DNA binding protein
MTGTRQGRKEPMSEPADAQDGYPAPVRFLTLRQVAEELNTKDSTIRALIRSGELQALQIGSRGQWRIERAKLEEYITAAYARAARELRNGEAGLSGRDPSDPRVSEPPR